MTDKDEATTEAASPVSAAVEETGACERLLKVDVAVERVAEEIDNGFETMNQSARVDGFRPGHVPRQLLEKRFGEDIRESVQQQLIADTLGELLEEHKLEPLGEPDVDDITFEEGQPLHYEAKLEVSPTFEVGDYTSIEVERPSAEPTDEEIDRAIEAMRRDRTRYDEVEDGKACEGDATSCDAVLRVGEEEIWSRAGLLVSLAEGDVAGLTLENFPGEMMGVGEGDVRSFSTKIPEAFPREELRGSDGTLELTVKAVRRPVVPELNEEFLDSLGFDSEDEMRDEVKENIARHKEREADRELVRRLEEALLAQVEFDLPPKALERRAAEHTARMRMQLLQRGMPADALKEMYEDLENRSQEEVSRDMRLEMICRQIADAERIYATETEVARRIDEMAASNRRRPAEVRGQLERDGMMGAFREMLRQEKVMEFVKEKATVKEESA